MKILERNVICWKYDVIILILLNIGSINVFYLIYYSRLIWTLKNHSRVILMRQLVEEEKWDRLEGRADKEKSGTWMLNTRICFGLPKKKKNGI